jgi:hypothetical protein
VVEKESTNEAPEQLADVRLLSTPRSRVSANSSLTEQHTPRSLGRLQVGMSSCRAKSQSSRRGAVAASVFRDSAGSGPGFLVLIILGGVVRFDTCRRHARKLLVLRIPEGDLQVDRFSGSSASQIVAFLHAIS